MIFSGSSLSIDFSLIIVSLLRPFSLLFSHLICFVLDLKVCKYPVEHFSLQSAFGTARSYILFVAECP